MRPTRRDDAHQRATRVYRWIVRLYPAAYRRLFGEQMLQTFHDHYRDTVASRKESETRFWFGVIADEMKALPRARLVTMQETWHRWTLAASVAQDRQEAISMTMFRPRLRRYWYLYLVALLLILSVATLYGVRKESTYESTASLFVTKQTIIKNLGGTDENVFATTAQNVSDQMAQLLQSSSFLKSVAQDTSLNVNHSLDDPSPQTADLGLTPAQGAAVSRIAGNITVSANQTRNLVFITSDDKDARVAQELAGGVVTEFTKFYAKKEQVTLKSAQDALNQQLKDTQEKLTKDTQAQNDYASKYPKVKDPLAAAADPNYQTLVNQVKADLDAQTSIQSDLGQIASQLTQANAGVPYDLTPQDVATLPRQQTVKASKAMVYPLGALVGVLVLFALTGISYQSRVAPE